MVEELISEGICSTCIHKPGCHANKNTRQAGRTVLYCEEFDDSASRKDGETFFSITPFAVTPCFSIKSLIPGWGH